MAQAKKFKIGDKTVYPAHGVGEVTDIQVRSLGGKERQFYILNVIENGMKIMVPVETATAAGLRAIMSKDKAKVDHWLKEVAPSTELRKWFGHDPEKWAEFQKRYRAELQGNPVLAELRALSAQGAVTLLYAARDEAHNEAVVLQKLLDDATT